MLTDETITVPGVGTFVWVRIKKEKEMSNTKKLRSKKKHKQYRKRIGVKWFGAVSLAS